MWDSTEANKIVRFNVLNTNNLYIQLKFNVINTFVLYDVRAVFVTFLRQTSKSHKTLMPQDVYDYLRMDSDFLHFCFIAFVFDNCSPILARRTEQVTRHFWQLTRPEHTVFKSKQKAVCVSKQGIVAWIRISINSGCAFRACTTTSS